MIVLIILKLADESETSSLSLSRKFDKTMPGFQNRGNADRIEETHGEKLLKKQGA